MSILSTNKRLIKVGQEYSAGSGISIDEGVISVTGEFGKTYSAGDNVSIYEQDEQLYISSKDWSYDIANASANAYNEAVAQIPDPFDPSYLSAQIDNKLNSSDFTTWQNGQYTTDLQTIEGQINNKLDTSSFSDVSGSFLTAHQSLDGYATEDWVTAQGYITGVDLSNYYTKDETSGKEELAQAFSDIPVGDPEVNAYVTNNSASLNGTTDLVQNSSGLWNDVAVYQSNSANYLTAHQDLSNYYTTAEADSLSSMFSGAIDYVSANAGSESNVITDNGEFTVLPNTLGTCVTIKYPMDAGSYDEPSAVPFHEGEWVDWVGNTGADPNNNGSCLGMILHYSDITPINLNGIKLRVTLPHTISGVTGMQLYYLNPGFYNPLAGPGASYSIPANNTTYSAGEYEFNCIGNPYSAQTGTYGCYLSLGFGRAANVYGPSSIDARFDTLEYGPATGYEVNLNRYVPSGDSYIGVGVNSATKQTIISATYSLTGDLNRIYPTYNTVRTNSATWNSVSSKVDKDSLLDLKSEFISDNGTYILHVPSACDIIGTQLSSYGIEESVLTSAFLTRKDYIGWQGGGIVGSAIFDVNTQSAYYDFQTDATNGIKIYIVDGNGNNVLTTAIDGYIPLTGTLTNLTPGSYTAKLESRTFASIQDKNTSLYFSGEGTSPKTYSGLFIGGVTGEFVPQSAFDELKQSYDALSSLFATYSGQWLLPNEGEE